MGEEGSKGCYGVFHVCVFFFFLFLFSRWNNKYRHDKLCAQSRPKTEEFQRVRDKVASDELISLFAFLFVVPTITQELTWG